MEKFLPTITRISLQTDNRITTGKLLKHKIYKITQKKLLKKCVFVVRTNVEAYNLNSTNQLKFDSELLWLGKANRPVLVILSFLLILIIPANFNMQNVSLSFLLFRLTLATILKFKMAIKTETSNIFSDFIVILDMGIATIWSL